MATRPAILDHIENALYNYKYNVLFEIDAYRKNIKTFVNDEISAQVASQKQSIEIKAKEISAIEKDNKKKKDLLLSSLALMNLIQ